LVLLPEYEALWAVEIHNWQTEDGERVCDVDQRVRLPRHIRVWADLVRVMGTIASRWEERS
jgi:hypothetical protein